MKNVIKTIFIMLGYCIISPILILVFLFYSLGGLILFSLIVVPREMFHDIYLELKKKEKIK